MTDEPTLEQWKDMTDDERELWYCPEWELEGHECTNVWCPGCE